MLKKKKLTIQIIKGWIDFTKPLIVTLKKIEAFSLLQALLRSNYMHWFLTKSRILFLVLLLSQSISLFAQKDSLLLSNGNEIVGELKSMKQGVATVKTGYSKSDFKIKWEKIKTVNTETEFLITIKSGKRYNGFLQSDENGEIHILHTSDTLISVPKDHIVFLNVVKTDFLSNFKASLGIGYNFTKADNLSQFSVRSTLGYRAKHWALNANYNDIRSSQDKTKSLKRLDAALGYQFYLKQNWFTVTEISWLSNTEQNIRLRTLGRLGVGKYIIQTNSAYWAVHSGASYNNESFRVYDVNKDSHSAEGFLATELSLYDIGDLTLLTHAIAYPSLTESGRWRFDYNLDVKYDLPLDFYINFGITLNYDNKPVKSGSEVDYVFQTTFGWSF